MKSHFTRGTLCALFSDHLINLSLFSLGKKAGFSVAGRQLDGDVLPQISSVLPPIKLCLLWTAVIHRLNAIDHPLF